MTTPTQADIDKAKDMWNRLQNIKERHYMLVAQALADEREKAFRTFNTEALIVATDWFTTAPKYRTKKTLLARIKEMFL